MSPAAFHGGVTASQASWFVLPPAPVMARQNIGALAGRTSQVLTKLTTLILPSGLQVTTRLPQLLDGINSNIVLARSLFTIGALELLLVSAAGLVLAARLLAGLRDEESALLRARGATRWQLTRPVLAEALVIGAVASAAGVLAGVRFTGVLARAGQLRLDSYQASRISPLAWLSALATLGLCVTVMAWPALRAGAPDAARIRQGRQARLAGVAWAGGDLAVVALAALAVWQLRGYSAVAHPAAGSLGIDPVVALAPALALAGVALVPLRTLPLLARLADGATDRGRRLAAAMVSWQIGRRSIRQAGPVLLVVVATATTTLALAGWASWQRSAADQAAFAVGSDVRVDAGAGGAAGHQGDRRGARRHRRDSGQHRQHRPRGPADRRGRGHGGQDDPAPPRPVAGSAELAVAEHHPTAARRGWRSPACRTGCRSSWRWGQAQGTSPAALRRDLGSATVRPLGPGYRRCQLPPSRRGAARRRPAACPGRRAAGPRQASYPLRLLSLSLPPIPAAVCHRRTRWPSPRPTSPLLPRGGRDGSGPRPAVPATVPPWRRRGGGSSPSVPTGPPGVSRRFRHRTAYGP